MTPRREDANVLAEVAKLHRPAVFESHTIDLARMLADSRTDQDLTTRGEVADARRDVHVAPSQSPDRSTAGPIDADADHRMLGCAIS